jgi:hypothetical protein
MTGRTCGGGIAGEVNAMDLVDELTEPLVERLLRNG